MPNEQQDAMIVWSRDLLERELPTTDLLMGDVDSPIVERCMARLAELGYFSFTIPADAGGGGLRYADEALMFRELGRSLAPGPVIATALAARLAADLGERALADALSSGECFAELAEVQDDGEVVRWQAGPADHVLMVTDGQFALVPAARLPAAEALDTIDPYHRTSRRSAGSRPSGIKAPRELSERLLAHGRLLVAAYLTGLAEAARDDSAEYAKTRVQFGKPIGVFQAVKHRCADNAVRAEAAWAQTAVAAVRLDDAGAAQAGMDVIAAKVVATNSAILNARDNIQNHGGMGYTAEIAAHLFLKRAHVLAMQLGEPRSFTATLLEGTPSW
jgi:alkylation response protein AidB-like acyl-CoA dehydrogenase